MKVHIIGGGIIGLCTAWYAQQLGYEVIVIDKGDLTQGTSHGNAGMIVPSHFIPLASPGVIAQGLRWMFNSRSPFFIKPRLNLELAQWLWKFYQSCTKENVKEAIPVLRDMNEASLELYKAFSEEEGFDFNFEHKGLLMLYQQAKTGEEERHMAETAHEIGMKAELLSSTEVQALETIPVQVEGAVYYPNDAHIYPNTFISQLTAQLEAKGVEFLKGKKVEGFMTQQGKVSTLHLSDNEQIPVAKVVLATGSWTGHLLQKLGIKMLLQDGKGYSITLRNPSLRPSIPAILTEAKVAITPMGADLRIGGTLELSNLSPAIDRNRFAGIIESVPQYYPALHIGPEHTQDIWYGFRPCSPDGLPYIGYSNKYSNLLIATGHAMMGLSLGPVTGKMVAELLQGKTPFISSPILDPNRF